MAPPSGQGESFLRNDAQLSVWVEEFERVVKNAWTQLNTLVADLDRRITELETRIADTYTWGQKGTLTVEEAEEGEEAVVTLLALPLRIVRKEEVVECTAAAEVPGMGGVLIVQHQHSGPDVPDVVPPGRRRPRADEEEVPWTDVATLTLEAGMKFVSVMLEEPFEMAKDDTLRVVIAEVGEPAEGDEGEDEEGLGDVVVQARCR